MFAVLWFVTFIGNAASISFYSLKNDYLLIPIFIIHALLAIILFLFILELLRTRSQIRQELARRKHNKYFYKKVVKFNKKQLWLSSFLLMFLMLFTIFQIVMLWITDLNFSLLIFNVKKIGSLSLKIISLVILVLLGFFIAFFTYKIFNFYYKKMFLRNAKLFVLYVFTLYIMIPNLIPLNYVVPIVVLFSFVIFVFQF